MPVLDTVGSTDTHLWITTLSSNGRGRARSDMYGAVGRWMLWQPPLVYLCPRVHL